MIKVIKKLLWVIFLPIGLPSIAQPFNDPPRDLTLQPVVLEPLREADVAFQWTIERIIDTREKQNLALNWPINSMRSLIIKDVLEGRATAYTGSDFNETYSAEVVTKLGVSCNIVEYPCPGSEDEICDTLVCDPPDYDKMVKWKVLEQWYFDKEQGRMIPRIIGMAVMYRQVVAGLELPETPLFWIKYEDVRETLAQNKMVNVHNEAASVSYDHFFQARLFSSYITKYPNAYDMNISEMEEFADNPMAARYESDRIKHKLFETEHDVWEY